MRERLSAVPEAVDDGGRAVRAAEDAEEIDADVGTGVAIGRRRRDLVVDHFGTGNHAPALAPQNAGAVTIDAVAIDVVIIVVTIVMIRPANEPPIIHRIFSDDFSPGRAACIASPGGGREALHEIHGGGKAAQAVLAVQAANERPEAERRVSIHPDLGERAGNRQQMANGANRLRRVQLIDRDLENLVAGSKRAPHDVEHAAIVKELQHIERGKHRFRVLAGRLIDTLTQRLARIAKRRLECDWTGHRSFPPFPPTLPLPLPFPLSRAPGV